tara:strand:- start:637 stop:2043 length:1407 start_codon:yes stop_codon:yes gene_type:complete
MGTVVLTSIIHQEPQRSFLILLVLLAALQGGNASAETPRSNDLRPNIIRIMADDLGYGELGSYGQKLIRTPNLDQMSAEGMRFTQYYAGSAACNPSRFAFSTGRHALTTGVITNGENFLPADSVTVGSVMQSAGYATGLIGKWALGDAGTSGEPLKQGFDYFFGYPTQRSAHNYYPETLTENRGSAILTGNRDSDRKLIAAGHKTYAPEVMQQRTLAFIRDNSKRTFYLQLDFNLPHINSELHRLTGNGFEIPGAGRYASEAGWTEVDRSYAEMVSLMDDYVGDILSTLHSLGIAGNTLVIFTSDNGPAGERSRESLERFAATGPFSGWKGRMHEGGIRVPMIAWWPGTIPAGTTNNALVTAWDELPTFAELIAARAKIESDGVSFAPLLKGANNPQQARFLYWRLDEKVAVRYGDWKWVGIRYHTPFEKNFLYNIALDPGELSNLAGSNPEQLHQLQAMVDKFRLAQ